MLASHVSNLFTAIFGYFAEISGINSRKIQSQNDTETQVGAYWLADSCKCSPGFAQACLSQ
jgi:hypothetical protein